MPSVEHSTTVNATPDVIWAFVRQMDNWAPFLTGYQSHEKIDEERSIWRLKGELGGLSRVAEFTVKILEWNEPNNVLFELLGKNEPVDGSGEFSVQTIAPEASTTSHLPPPQMSLLDKISRWILSMVFRKPKATERKDVAETAQALLTFKVTVTARGATGTILNVLLKPMLKPVAEDLANNIANEIERRAKI